VKDIARGEAFTNENVRSIRPAYGVAPKHLDALLGHAAQRDIKFGEPIIQADLESL
jgi:pseudaminic acid synthase